MITTSQLQILRDYRDNLAITHEQIRTPKTLEEHSQKYKIMEEFYRVANFITLKLAQGEVMVDEKIKI